METKKRREGRRRLHIDVPDFIYRELKLMAVDYQCTMTKIVLRALLDKFKKERGFKGYEEKL